MTLKGVMTIELTDANTGAVETVTEENMIIAAYFEGSEETCG